MLRCVRFKATGSWITRYGGNKTAAAGASSDTNSNCETYAARETEEVANEPEAEVANESETHATSETGVSVFFRSFIAKITLTPLSRLRSRAAQHGAVKLPAP
jgi:hypothetical protein